jgi:PIN domain nuclease of toxin-antitoxin system
LALLIDTNVLIWLYEDDQRLSKRAAIRIASGEEPLFVSVVSAWEYGQKRLKWPNVFRQPFDAIIDSLPYESLDLEYAVHEFAETLPQIHRDPFDRMLIAQAIHHDLTLIASDSKIQRYPVRWFW